MAPIRDETVDALKDLIHQLQSRVEQLEARLHDKDGSRGPTEQMRMILMGPPGAGRSSPVGSRFIVESMRWSNV